MTAVEQFIAEIEQELQEREGCNGALNSGVVLGLTNAKKIAFKYLEVEKWQIKDAWINSLTKGDFNSGEEYYNQTFKSE